MVAVRPVLAFASVALLCLAPSALGYSWTRMATAPGGASVSGTGDVGIVSCELILGGTQSGCSYGGLGGAIFDVSSMGSGLPFAQGTCEADLSFPFSGTLSCGTDRDDTFVTNVDLTGSNDADGYDDELAQGRTGWPLNVCFSRDRDDSDPANAAGGDWDEVYAFVDSDGNSQPSFAYVTLSLGASYGCGYRSGHNNADFTGGSGTGSSDGPVKAATLLWQDSGICPSLVDVGHAGACGIKACPNGVTSPPAPNQVAVVCGITVPNPANGAGVINCRDYNAQHGNPYPGQNDGEVLDLAPAGPGGGDVAACAGLTTCPGGTPGLLVDNVAACGTNVCPGGNVLGTPGPNDLAVFCGIPVPKPAACGTTSPGPGWTAGAQGVCVGLPWVVQGAVPGCTSPVNVMVYWGTTPGFAPGSTSAVCP